MSDLAELAQQLVERHDLDTLGAVETAMPGVRLFFHDQPVARGPLLYTSGIVVLVTGRKVAFLGNQRFAYDPENYLTLGLPLAMECETAASEADPLFAIYIEVDPVLLRDVALAMDLDLDASAPREPAIAAAPLEPEMRDAVRRLMRHLLSDGDTAVLGEGTRREIVYRALQGDAGRALGSLLKKDGQAERVAEVMQSMHDRLAERISVDAMARMAGMSSSVFYRVFRNLTNDTPLQYLKKVRLSKARDLILRDGQRVSAAAAAVGYESPAQFSRDFRNHFGISAAKLKNGASSNRPIPLSLP